MAESIESKERPPYLFNIYDQLNDASSQSGISAVEISLKSGFNTNISIRYVTLQPGARISEPLAHSLQDTLITCLSGTGLIWQNGWTYPFQAADTAGWKANTGLPHTVINNGDDDLLLLVVEEKIDGNEIHYPLRPDSSTTLINNITLDALISDAQGTVPRKTKPEDEQIWKNPPRQNDLGPHPGVSTQFLNMSTKENPSDLLDVPRPSNIAHGLTEISPLGEDDLYAEGTSLSAVTGLSGRFGVNLEVLLPGTRSSLPHAHSLESELVFVLAGEGLVWLNGTVYPVCGGDVVGLPSGTGIAHTFINDEKPCEDEFEEGGSEEGGNTGGSPLVLWIFGENKRRSGDRVFYPLHPEKERTFERWWEDCPYHDLGEWWIGLKLA